jgi:tRNA (guanine-N7-)-methyltransferase
MAQQQPPGAIKKRSIRSFVKRTGRLTTGQQQALEQLWPVYGIEFNPDSTLDFTALFPGKSGFKLEIGFGNGDSLVQMAAEDSDAGYLGVEVHEPGVGHCLNQLNQRGLDNLCLMRRDALDVLEYMTPDQCLDRVFLFFPDPWHKKKHHKRRIVNQEFRDLLCRRLKPGGVLHMATDWQDYAEHMAEDLLSDARFENLGNEQGFHPRPDYRPLTKFEQRGQRLGHGVWDLLFCLRA